MILMKKMYLFITFLLCYICFIDNVYASCTNEDIGRVKELAKNITVDYEFVGIKKYGDASQFYSVSFDFGELENEVFAQDVNDKEMKFDLSNVGAYLYAGKHTFNIYYSKCAKVKLRTIEVDLKKYNEYASRDECKGLQDTVDICGEWYQGNISEDYFVNYMKKNHSKKIKFDINFIVEHKWYVIAGFGVIAIIGIIFMVRGFKKNRLD